MKTDPSNTFETPAMTTLASVAVRALAVTKLPDAAARTSKACKPMVADNNNS